MHVVCVVCVYVCDVEVVCESTCVLTLGNELVAKVAASRPRQCDRSTAVRSMCMPGGSRRRPSLCAHSAHSMRRGPSRSFRRHTRSDDDGDGSWKPSEMIAADLSRRFIASNSSIRRSSFNPLLLRLLLTEEVERDRRTMTTRCSWRGNAAGDDATLGRSDEKCLGGHSHDGNSQHEPVRLHLCEDDEVWRGCPGSLGQQRAADTEGCNRGATSRSELYVSPCSSARATRPKTTYG